MGNSKKVDRCVVTDHVCRECGGRVLQVTNPGPTGGGNGIYLCADCGVKSSGMGPSCICWCGSRHKGQEGVGGYRCVHIVKGQADPALKLALMRSGFTMVGNRRPKVEVGVVSEDGISWARNHIESQDKAGE